MATHTTLVRFALLAALVTLTACGSDEPKNHLVPEVDDTELAHTPTSIVLDSGRVITIPDDAVKIRAEPGGKPYVEEEWVYANFTLAEYDEITTACRRENRKLQAIKNDPWIEVPRPLGWMCSSIARTGFKDYQPQ